MAERGIGMFPHAKHNESSAVATSGLCVTEHTGSSTRHRLWRHRVEAGNHVEQLFVDATLAGPMELGAQIREQLADVAIGALRPPANSTKLYAMGFRSAVGPRPGKPSPPDIRAALKRAGTPIGSHGLFIAAHARSRGMTLLMHNMREFERVPGLRVEDWRAAPA